MKSRNFSERFRLSFFFGSLDISHPIKNDRTFLRFSVSSNLPQECIGPNSVVKTDQKSETIAGFTINRLFRKNNLDYNTKLISNYFRLFYY